jgi:hypothetical protein
MLFKKSAVILLPVLAVLTMSPSYAEDMPVLENYKPPPQLFDDPPAEPDTTPFLTWVAPEEEAKPETVAIKAPAPPRKPTSPLRKKSETAKKAAVKKAPVKKPVPVKTAGKRSKTQLDDGQRLANPNVRDILASIEGIKPPKANSSGGVSLAFVSGETALTFDMKNKLLRDYLPRIKSSTARIAIQAYATPDKTGETSDRRISLARALEIKGFLEAAGIDPGRIDVMPLGNQPDAKAADRVDIVTVSAKR